MSFSSTLLHARKSRANSEISELLTARRMDITVWMSSPNDVVPAVAEAGSDTGGSRRTASRRSRSGPRWQRGLWFTPRVGDGARGGSRGAFGHPHSWPYAAGDNSRRRVSPDSRVRGHLWSNVGPNISRSAGPHDSWRPRGRTTGSGGTALTFLCGASTGYPRGTHHVQIIEYILGFLGPGKDGENCHNGEPSLWQSLCTECTGKPWPQRSAWISSTGKSVGMPRITAFSLRSSRAYV
ncbi:hypothetical protein EVAR_90116_1 [Eumeta japonica]|uniref:Uncharacterized protein n=1 Tax=Eumeta variegata TaxID=151549 RepID=A0A4C1ZZX2_EUMVA|nr:hypothetical protein EVAR_90116_1 [Eumeta japonica]